MKHVLLFMAALMALGVSLAFAGGRGQQQAVSDGNGPLEFEWAVFLGGRPPNPDSEAKKYIEEKFNVKITVPLDADMTDANLRNLYWASGNRPDFVTCNQGRSVLLSWINQGILRSIPDGWLDLYMPDNMKNLYTYADKEEVYKQLTIDGKVYQLPDGFIGPQNPTGMVIRQDWLDNLGISKLPETLEEFHDVLRRFTFDDPDGNGRKDTYGMHGGVGNWFGGFKYVDVVMDVSHMSFRETGGKVTFNDVTDNYKTYLKLLRDWYREGIIDPETFTDNRAGVWQKWSNGLYGVHSDNVSYLAPQTSGFSAVTSLQTAIPTAKVTFLPPLKNVRGERLSPTYQDLTVNIAFFTTKASDEVVKKCLEIKNEMAKDVEFYKRLRFGIEGRDYDVVDGIITPRPIMTVDYWVEKGLVTQYTTNISFPMATASAMGYFGKEASAMTNTLASYGKFIGGHNFVHYNFATPVSEAFNLYMTDIATMCNEYYANAVTGAVDIDATWEAFKKSLYDAGLQKIIDDYEAALKAR